MWGEELINSANACQPAESKQRAVMEISWHGALGAARTSARGSMMALLQGREKWQHGHQAWEQRNGEDEGVRRCVCVPWGRNRCHLMSHLCHHQNVEGSTRAEPRSLYPLPCRITGKPVAQQKAALILTLY